MPSNREHWKDVSLDLLGEKAAKMTKEKSKRSKHHGKPHLTDKEREGMNPISVGLYYFSSLYYFNNVNKVAYVTLYFDPEMCIML